jgi:UDP-GlcNAc3NAcA epimerase
MKIITIVGARPQFIKAAPLSKLLRNHHTEILIHTGQHYDDNMSSVFFRELGLPEPDYNLNIGSANHGAQTGAMIAGIEKVLLSEKPCLVIVYGDTNSTVAGALAAVKMHIPVAHVEAGLRSFNKAMPEEINRIMTDHISDWLFVPSETSRENLAREGIAKCVYDVGDIMFDAVLLFSEFARERSSYPRAIGLEEKSFYLCTIHRPENTDNCDKLSRIFSILSAVGKPVVLPLHPRTRKKISDYRISIAENILFVEPLGYLDMLSTMSSACSVITDSGGIQKEAYYLGVSCVTMRCEAEWIETVETGWNSVTGVDERRVLETLDRYSCGMPPRPQLYGSGDTSSRIVTLLETA